MQMNKAVPVTSERSSVLARMGTFRSCNGSYGTFGDYNSYTHNSGFRLSRQRWYAMFVKRVLHTKRHKLAILSQLVLPLLFTLLAIVNAASIRKPKDSPSLTLSTHNFMENHVPWSADR